MEMNQNCIVEMGLTSSGVVVVEEMDMAVAVEVDMVVVVLEVDMAVAVEVDMVVVVEVDMVVVVEEVDMAVEKVAAINTIYRPHDSHKYCRNGFDFKYSLNIN